jgi:hypothetical protein
MNSQHFLNEIRVKAHCKSPMVGRTIRPEVCSCWELQYTVCGHYHICYIHTYIPLMLYPRRGSRGILDIPPKRPRFTKIILLWVILQTWQVVSPSPRLIAVYLSTVQYSTVQCQRNIWDASATLSGIRPQWYVCMYWIQMKIYSAINEHITFALNERRRT